MILRLLKCRRQIACALRLTSTGQRRSMLPILLGRLVPCHKTAIDGTAMAINGSLRRMYLPTSASEAWPVCPLTLQASPPPPPPLVPNPPPHDFPKHPP